MSEDKLKKVIASINADKKMDDAEKASAIEFAKERDAMEDAAETENAKRTGKGLRVQVGATRGRSTTNISYEAFDESAPDSLPKTVEEFVSLTGIKSNADLVSMLITGFNDRAYKEASDPIAEFISKSWPADIQATFRLTVRNLAKTLEMPLDEAAKEVKARLEKKLAK